jgi:hypothetical protein
LVNLTILQKNLLEGKTRLNQREKKKKKNKTKNYLKGALIVHKEQFA